MAQTLAGGGGCWPAPGTGLARPFPCTHPSACQNTCPHKREAVLSRGILGDQQDVPKVACPMHKKTFSLESGACLSGEDYRVRVFPVRVEGEDVYVELPSESTLKRRAAAPSACAITCG